MGRDIANTGGGEVIKQVSTRMAGNGWLVTVITDTPTSELHLPGVRVLTTPFGAQLLRWNPGNRLGWTLRHALQILVFTVSSTLMAIPLRAKGAIVFNHNCEALLGQVLVMHNVFSAELRRRELGTVRTIMALINPVRAMRIAKELLLARPSANRTLVAVSDAASADAVALAGNEHRVVTIPNGVDLVAFDRATPAPTSPDGFTSWQRLGSLDRIILFVGHEFKRKGLRDLIAALSQLPDDVGLMVAGGAAENIDDYRAIIASLGIRPERVWFAGKISDIRPFMRASHVLCLPSYYESMGLVGLEALASGVPIVVTSEVPLSELVVPGLNGAVCTHSPANIAAALQSVLSSEVAVLSPDRVAGTVAGFGWPSRAEAYGHLASTVAAERWTGGVSRG